MKRCFIISIFLNLLLIGALYYVGECRTDYFERMFARVFGKMYVPPRADDDCVNSWNSCIRKLNLDVDVVFFGDSITEGGSWQDYFPNQKTITLAYIGEDTKMMLRRVNSIAEVKPEKVFLMAGINGLKDQSLEEFEQSYYILLDSICNVVPRSEVYVQSILPISVESQLCSNQKIVDANFVIKKMVSESFSINVHYIDLWKEYAREDALPNELCYDGLHLNENSYIYWVNTIREFVEE